MSRMRSCRYGQILHKKDIRPRGHLLDRTVRRMFTVDVFFVKLKGVSGHLAGQFIVLWVNVSIIQRTRTIISSIMILGEFEIRVMGDTQKTSGSQKIFVVSKLALMN